MPFSVEQLISDRQELVVVLPKASLQTALNLMIEHDFSQLPVVDGTKKSLGIVTSDSVVRALNHFGLTTENLLVRHALIKAQEVSIDSDVFSLLNDLRESYAVLVLDSKRDLIGIVTSYDTTEYFQRQAEDRMYVQDIEEMLRDYILATISQVGDEPDPVELDAAIKDITPSRKQEESLFLKAVKAYSEGQKSDFNPECARKVFAEHFNNKVSQKTFDKLTFNDHIDLFLREERWEKHFQHVFSLPTKALRKLLTSVRDTRNDLSHLRGGGISSVQRQELRACTNLCI